MRFVLGNRLMTIAGGTEVHLVTIGDQLLRLGHDVVIYSPELGPFADHARRRGIDVVDALRMLPNECDVVFAQDGIVAYDLAARYPKAVNVFRICGDVFDFQSPPQVEGLVDLVVVLSDRYARLAHACAVAAPVLRLRLPVDVERIVPLGRIHTRPRRAVILGNYPDRIQAVRDAWEGRGIEVSQVGGAQQRYDIAAALAAADIVVAKSRAALDAMASGRAVYVYDMFGGDGWVTPETYGVMEADQFAGQATDRVIGVSELERDLADYDPGMGTVNRDLVLQHHSARDHTIAFLAAVAASAPAERPAVPLRELARLTAMQWSWEGLARGAQLAHAASEVQLAETRGRAVEAAGLRAELDAIKASRAWRLAGRYWLWRDRFRLRIRSDTPEPSERNEELRHEEKGTARRVPDGADETGVSRPKS